MISFIWMRSYLGWFSCNSNNHPFIFHSFLSSQHDFDSNWCVKWMNLGQVVIQFISFFRENISSILLWPWQEKVFLYFDLCLRSSWWLFIYINKTIYVTLWLFVTMTIKKVHHVHSHSTLSRPVVVRGFSVKEI